MSLKIRIITFLLAIIACLSLSACNNSTGDSSDDDTPGDEFSGSISGDKNEGEKPDDSATEDEGDPDSVTTITTAEQLKAMKRKGSYILAADIDLGGEAWTPIGSHGAPFEGTFDGKGFKITGLKVNSAKADSGISISYQYAYYGFFGVTSGAVIKDVKFESAEINASSNEKFLNIYAGILAGSMTDTEVLNCEFSGNVNAVSSNCIAYAGSVAGITKGTKVTDCTSSADIKTENSPIRAISGGIIGYTRPDTKITDCSVKGKVFASSTIGIAYAGGITGFCHTSEISRCTYLGSEIYAEVTLSSPETGAKGAAHAAGITAIATGSDEEKPVILTKCYTLNTTVKAYSVENSVYTSGIASEAEYTKVIDCYSYASLESESVNAIASSAGLFNSILNTCTVEHSFFLGKIKADANETSVGTVSNSKLDEEDYDKVFLSASYKSDTEFTINGVTYTKAQNKDILDQGTARQSNIFATLSLLCDVMSWNPDEWQIKDGFLTFAE